MVLAAQEQSVAKILMERIAQKVCIPYREGVEFSVTKRAMAIGGQVMNIQGVFGEYKDIYLPLYGAHQASNAAVSLATVEAFVGSKLSDELVQGAFNQVTSPGRLEILYRDPTVIVDAAHNPHGGQALVAALSEEFGFDRIIAVVGMFADKDVQGFLALLEPIFSQHRHLALSLQLLHMLVQQAGIGGVQFKQFQLIF